MKNYLGALLLGAFLTPLGVIHADTFADEVVSYTAYTGGTPGINTSFETPSAALGAPTSSGTIIAPAFSSSQIVGIGNGGELTVEFNNPITNDPVDHAFGMDFTIFGNDFFTPPSSITSTFDHPGVTVWVSQDNVNYYELKVPDGYGADDSFPEQGSGNPLLPVNSSLTLSSFNGLSEAQALSLYNGSAGGASFSISWAEDGSGNPVNLSSISYVEVEGTSGYGYVDAFSSVESVPEPSGALLLFAGMGVLLFYRRPRGNPERPDKLPGRRITGKPIIALALAFFATLAGLRADTSYLLIQGPFGSSGATETFQWQVNYQSGVLQTGQDLLSAVFGTPSLNGTYTDVYDDVYNYYTAGNSTKGVGYIDFGSNPTELTEPFVASFTLGAMAVVQDPSYSPGWNYYVAGGGSNNGNGYPNSGAWTFSNDGTDSRTLVNGSFDAWVFGATNPDGGPVTFVQGSSNTSTTANFANAMVINVVPEPASAVLLACGAGGTLALFRKRRAWHRPRP